MKNLTILWGKDTEIIFPGWPGQCFLSYMLAFGLVFSISLLVEWLSHVKLIKTRTTNNFIAGIIQTGIYAFRIALAYLVMLAVMSFNIGILLAAVAGYAIGFFLFGSRAFRNFEMVPLEHDPDLPPLNC